MNNKRRKAPPSMADFSCTYCFRKYKKKENYDKHVQCCEFFYRSRMQHADIAYEPLPSQRELYQLVKELAYKCDKLQKKLDKLESTSTTKQRKHIAEYLQDRVPQMTAFQWAHQIEISQQHLETIFENSIIEGISQSIRDHIHIVSLLPFCAFSQKQNTIYIYNTESDDQDAPPQWHAMNNKQLDKIISIISYKILRAFMEWQQNHYQQYLHNDYEYEPELETPNEQNSREQQITDDVKKQHIVYMIKINGSRISDDKKRIEIKKVLYNTIQKPLPTTIELSA
jgi:NADH:ubiquinone oxidoreductase subunit